MAVEFVQSNQVLNVNGETYSFSRYNPNIVAQQIQKLIPCNGIDIVNSFWMIPTKQGARVIGYNYTVATTSTPPTIDSVKILRIKIRQSQEQIDIAIANTDHLPTSSPTDQFSSYCNAAGGSLSVMPTVTVPFPVLQNKPSSTNSSGTNVFTFPFPNNPLALLYSIPYQFFNGAAPGTPYAPTGITTPAQFVTWANTNQGAYGTWASSGNIVTLTSPTSATTPVNFAGMEVDLAAAPYCLTPSGTPQNVNGVNIGGTVYTFPGFALSTANPLNLVNAISKFFPGATITVTGSNKIQISTIEQPVAITYNGSTVSGLTFASGVCS